jgi:hypothetical protein
MNKGEIFKLNIKKKKKRKKLFIKNLINKG